MRYTETQIIQLLRAPKFRDKINKGRYYEQELRLYTEAQTADELKADEAYTNLCATIAKRIPAKSYNRVMDFIEYPLAAVELTGGLLVELYKVFNAQNVYLTHEIDTEAKNKQLKDIVKGLDVQMYVIEEGKKCLKNKPNTIVVVDKDSAGQPYLVTVPSERLIDGDIQPNGTFKSYIAFEHSEVEGFPNKRRIAFYDDEYYNVYVYDKSAQTYTLESSVPHKIGYCPARCILKDPLNSKNAYKRLNPLAVNLGQIREWQLFNTYKYYTEHYAAFPVVEKVKHKCDNTECINGTVPRPNGVFFADGQRQELPRIACPTCAKREDVGVGTVINLKPKTNKDEENSAGTFRFIAPEITGVEYLETKLEKLEKYIELKTVGQSNLITKEAVNEKQVEGSFQSKETVLMNLKTTFEEIYIWIIETAAKAYFLGDVQVIVYANFGSEFYLSSEDELQDRFENAKTIGLPESEVDAIYNQLVTTKYKDNPDAALRMVLMKYLDPAPYATFDEVDKLKTAGVLSEEEYIIKRRFIKFIEKFEMKNGSLINFGKKLPLSDRIDNIFNILKSYSNEYIKKDSAEQLPSDTKPVEGT